VHLSLALGFLLEPLLFVLTIDESLTSGELALDLLESGSVVVIDPWMREDFGH
jgi:hypothetical protein